MGKHWRGVVSSVIIAILATITLSLQLTSLVPGQNRFETATLTELQHFPSPLHRAVNAPYMVTAFAVGKIINNPLHGARITSVVFGLLATACFFYLLKLWFSTKLATVGSLLFITSSWLLHISHQAAPFILLVFAPLLVLLPLAWYLRTKKYKNLAFYLFAASLGFAAYVPFMPWIIAVLLVVVLVKEKHHLQKLSYWTVVISAVIYFAVLAPLFISLAIHPGQARELVGLPAHVPSISMYFSQFYHTPLMLLFKSQPLSEIHLGSLPMLDIFSSAMFALGLYYYAVRLPKRRSVIIFACMLILFLIIPLSDNYQLAIAALLPFIFLCIMGGVVELLNQWFSYFPRNPWARNVGVALVVAAIGFSSFYHLQRYFIAWPNAPATKSVYVVKSK